MRALRRLQREQEPKSPFVFTSERGSPFSTSGQARGTCRRAAKLGFLAHPQAHACGFALANKGHDTRALQAYLGHRNIQHTVRYTELSADRFKDFWKGRGRNDRHRSDSRPLEQHHSDGRPLELPMTVRSSNTGFIVYALRVRL